MPRYLTRMSVFWTRMRLRGEILTRLKILPGDGLFQGRHTSTTLALHPTAPVNTERSFLRQASVKCGAGVSSLKKSIAGKDLQSREDLSSQPHPRPEY